MLPILFIVPRFSLSLLFILLISVSLLFTVLFFVLRKKTNSVKKLKEELFSYYIFTMIIIILLQIFGPFPLRTYGVAVALGFLSAILTARYLSKKNGLNPDIILDLAVYVLIGTIIGARLFFVIFYDWQYFISHPLNIFAIWEGGLVFYGGLIGGISAGVYFVKKNKLNVLAYADIATPGVFLGYFFGRLGCLAYGCCFGEIAPKWFPFALKFPAIGNKLIGYTPAYEHHLHQGLLTGIEKFSLPVYPAQLISSLNGLILFLIFFYLYQKYHKFSGRITGLGLMTYAVTRSLIELLRIEPRFLYLSISQWISVAIFIFGLAVYQHAKKLSSLKS